MTEDWGSKETVQASLKPNRSLQGQAENDELKRRTVETLRELAKTLSVAVDVLSTQEGPTFNEPIDFYKEVRKFEIKLIQRALRKTCGNQAQAARLLSLNQPTLHGKIKQYKIHPEILLFDDHSTQT